MIRHRHAVDRDGLAIRYALDRPTSEPGFGKHAPRLGDEIALAAPAEVVAVRMSHQCARDRLPRVDVKVARGAVESAVGGDEECQGTYGAGDNASSFRRVPL